MRRFEVADLLPDDPSAGLCGRPSVRRHEREPRAPKALIDRSERRVPEDKKQPTPIRTNAQAGSVHRSVHSQCLRSWGAKPGLLNANTLSPVAPLQNGAPMRPSSRADGRARARQAHAGNGSHRQAQSRNELQKPCAVTSKLARRKSFSNAIPFRRAARSRRRRRWFAPPLATLPNPRRAATPRPPQG
jgi:hypothetical protein